MLDWCREEWEKRINHISDYLGLSQKGKEQLATKLDFVFKESAEEIFKEMNEEPIVKILREKLKDISNEEIEKTKVYNLVRKLKKICLYMILNEPELTLNFSTEP